MVEAGAPEWTEEDTALALGWKQFEASLCGGCGHEKGLAYALGADDDWTAEAVGCHACATRDRAMSKFRESGEAAGVYWMVRHDPRG